eukprot:2035946-Amphidinium_carterae.1
MQRWTVTGRVLQKLHKKVELWLKRKDVRESDVKRLQSLRQLPGQLCSWLRLHCSNAQMLVEFRE